MLKKLFLQAGQKDPRSEARAKPTSGGVHARYVGRGGRAQRSRWVVFNGLSYSPPFTSTIAPLTKLAASEAKNSATLATSSALPARPRAIFFNASEDSSCQ